MSDNCGMCGRPVPKTTPELRAEFKEKLKLAHDALDAFAEKRLVDTRFHDELTRARAAVEAVLRFGVSGSLYDPKLDPRTTPMWGLITPLTDDAQAAREGRE